MLTKTQERILVFLVGLLTGVLLATGGSLVLYKSYKTFVQAKESGQYGVFIQSIKQRLLFFSLSKYRELKEDFSKPLAAESGKGFGQEGQLTFELFRGGTFVINGKSGYAWQKSDSYRDSAFIRSTKPLPKTYKISVVVGGIDYDLEKIEGLANDPEYPEGPKNENGCYLLSITDEPPTGHHTNIWWHQHRKVVIDVDNNIWGSGMPNPIFMVYFDRNNKLNAFDGKTSAWQRDWTNAVSYDPQEWYKIEIEKTKTKFIMSIYTEQGSLLKRGEVPLKDVWNEDEHHQDYFVLGDPHENYYQGSMKIKSITIKY